MRRHVRTGIAAAVAVAAVLVSAAPAGAAALVTWQTTSRYVDPAKATSGYNHPGAPARPNALRVNVYLPDGYRPDSRRRYPVLFLLHGVGDAYDSWALPGQGEIMTTAAGFPGFIVMPEADRGMYTNWWNGGMRGDPGWERYHLDELIPLVERRLPILPGRRWHSIFGFSMGGLGAMFYASQRPGYFGSAGSSQGLLSIQRAEFQAPPAFSAFIEQDERAIFGDPSAQEFYWAGHNPLKLLENLRHTRMYVAVGNGVPGSPSEVGAGQASELELAMQAQEFVAEANARGEPVTYRPQQGTHAWVYRRRHLVDAIANWGLFAPVADQPASWSYSTVARHGRMWDLRYDFVAAPDRLETFVRAGDRLSGAGSGTVAIETSDGCRITVTLPFEVVLPHGCRGSASRTRLILRVAPARVRAGRQRRFRFAVSATGGGGTVAGATVRLARHRVRTDVHGAAALVLRLDRPGRYAVRASRPGLRDARATVTVTRSRGPRFTG